MNIECSLESLDYVARLGLSKEKIRPLLQRFVTFSKNMLVLRNRNKLKETCFNLDEDYSLEMRLKRKSLVPEMKKLGSEGKIAVLKMDKIVIREGTYENKPGKQEDWIYWNGMKKRLRSKKERARDSQKLKMFQQKVWPVL